MASSSGNYNIVSLLVSAGADPDATSPDGNTALMYAASECKVLTAEALLSCHADVTLANRAGNTALDVWHASCAAYPALEMAWQEQTGRYFYRLDALRV